MKDEIKEILEYILSLTYGNENAIKGINKVEDYITNLQEELKSANESITWWQNRFNAIERDNKNYKSRCDKAIDILEELIAEFQLNDYITDFDKKMNKPLNILQGSDKE